MRRFSAVILFAVLAVPAIAFPRRELAQWLQNVTVRQTADGALQFGDCYDRRSADGLAFATGLGGRISADLAPLRREFARRLGAQSLAPDLLTRAYRNLVMTEGPALLGARSAELEAVGADLATTVAAPITAAATCTTGRCDCGACGAGETCTCRTPDYECARGHCLMTGCSGARADCNVTIYEPKKLDTQNDAAAEALGYGAADGR